jgi:hypothetical protein
LTNAICCTYSSHCQALKALNVHYFAKNYPMPLRILLILLVLSSASLLPAQEESFNKRYYFGYAAATINGIYPTDSCIYITGLLVDTVYFNTGLFIAKLNTEGSVTSYRTYFEDGVDLENWYGGLEPIDSLLGTSIVMKGASRKSGLALFDAQLNLVDTILKESLFAPEETFMRPAALCVNSKSQILLSSYAINPVGTNNSETVLWLLKLDSDFEWIDYYGTTFFWESPNSISSSNCDFTIGSTKSNLNRVRKNYTFQHHIYAIDTLGNVQWNYLSPIDQLLSKGVSIYAEPDGSVIAAGFKGEEFSVNAVSGAINWSTAYIYKLNPQHQLEWEVEFHEPFPTMFGSSLTKIIKASDGTGYLAAGNIHRVISFQPPDADSDGWLVKVSPEGDSLWSRHYRFFEEGVDGETHEIFELKEMPGGGYLMGGQTIYGNEPTGPIQRGWLLRVDEEGCLVPGCHLVSSEEEAAAPALSLHLYPNPAQEYLYVLLRDAGIARRRGAALQLLDLQGRILQSHPASRIDEVTSILPVPGLPAGAYVLRYVADGQVLAAERVVVR